MLPWTGSFLSRMSKVKMWSGGSRIPGEVRVLRGFERMLGTWFGEDCVSDTGQGGGAGWWDGSWQAVFQGLQADWHGCTWEWAWETHTTRKPVPEGKCMAWWRTLNDGDFLPVIHLEDSPGRSGCCVFCSESIFCRSGMWQCDRHCLGQTPKSDLCPSAVFFGGQRVVCTCTDVTDLKCYSEI